MLFVIWMVLVALIQVATTGCVQNTDPSYVCNDELIKTISLKMALLEVTIQNIQLNLHTSSVFNYEQFEELKSAVYALDYHMDKHKHCPSNATTTWGYFATSSTAGGFRTNADGVAINKNSNASGASSTAPTAATALKACAIATVPTNLCQNGQNGIQLIQIPNSKQNPFFINCIQDLQQGDDPWILIQRRRDGSINFTRNWIDYQQGFGNLDGEFFIGLDKLHALTQSALYELWIQMEDFSNATRWARYSSFAIGDESQAYALNILGSFTGNAGDSLTFHQGHKFSTHDKDHDTSSHNCGLRYFGGWWYKDCHKSNLNGKYLRGKYPNHTAFGIEWMAWHGIFYSLKYVHMAIRPVRSS